MNGAQYIQIVCTMYIPTHGTMNASWLHAFHPLATDVFASSKPAIWTQHAEGHYYDYA